MTTTRKSKLTDHSLAAAAGVAESTWRVHKQLGAPRPRNGSDVQHWVAVYTTWRSERARRPGPAPREPAESDPKLAHWSGERMRWLAIRNRTAALRELRLLVRRDDVVQFAAAAALTIRNRLNQLVQKLGNQFGEEVLEAAQQEVDDALASFERGLEPAHGIAGSERINGTDDVASTGETRAADAEAITPPATSAGMTPE